MTVIRFINDGILPTKAPAPHTIVRRLR
jgi:hypothetical protein